MSSIQLHKTLMVCATLIVSAGVRAQEAPLPASEAKPVALAATPVASGAMPVALEAGATSVRIVRLSQARGGVQMDRGLGRGFEPAFTNIPVIAGGVLRTTDGIAEVEFEDNSTLRLTPGTEVRFLQLSRTAAGGTETTVSVVKGVVYAGLEKTKGNLFQLEDGRAQLVLDPGAHVRLDASKPEAEFAVFDGGAAVKLGGVTTTMVKRETVQLNPAVQTVSAVARGTQEADFDAWDKQSVDYHHQKAGLAGSGGFGLYGANDLNYYGSFVDMPGCGSMWRPYLASASFDPFANGVWAYYPHAGYSWVSPYPWGWLPFHSGAWAQCGAGGWGWRPGGGAGWAGLTNAPLMKLAKHPLSHPEPGPPVRGQPTLVAVNMRPLTASGVTGGSFTFRKDSAGLGVPRAEFGNLRGVSSHVEQHGVATSAVAGGSGAAGLGYIGNTTVGGRTVSAGVTRAGTLSSGAAGATHSASTSMASAGAGASSRAATSAPSASSSAGASAPAHR